MGRGGSGAFFLGLTLFVVGVGATVFTYMNAAPGGTYVVFIGLIVGGLIRMVTALIGGGFGASAFATRSNKKKLGPQKPSWYEDPSAQYVEKLADVPSGYCWQCGTKLRRGRTLCMACGAAQNSVAPQRDSSATPGGMTFGPPPKLAGSGHPYDAENVPQPPPTAPPPRAYFPADPDGSYGWGPAYAPNDDRGGRSNPGYQPGGQPQRSGPGDARRYVPPPPGREAPRAERSYGSSSRHSGDLPPARHSGDLPPRHSGELSSPRHTGDLPARHSGDLPPVGRRHSGPLVDDEPPPGRRAGRSDDERRQPPRGRRPSDDGWDDDEDERRYDQRRASSPRHAARPRPRPPYDRDADGWDDDDRGHPSSGRHPSRR